MSVSLQIDIDASYNFTNIVAANFDRSTLLDILTT